MVPRKTYRKGYFLVNYLDFWGLVPGIVSWVLGLVFWVLGFVFWVLGFVFWVLGLMNLSKVLPLVRLPSLGACKSFCQVCRDCFSFCPVPALNAPTQKTAQKCKFCIFFCIFWARDHVQGLLQILRFNFPSKMPDLDAYLSRYCHFRCF